MNMVEQVILLGRSVSAVSDPVTALAQFAGFLSLSLSRPLLPCTKQKEEHIDIIDPFISQLQLNI